MAKKQKDKKINNVDTIIQTNRQYNGQKHKHKKRNNGRHINTQTNRQYNGQEKKR